MFLFGLTSDQVDQTRAHGYNPHHFYQTDQEIRQALDAIAGGMFSQGDQGRFRGLVENLVDRDHFLVLADYRAYANCQKAVDEAYRDQTTWTRKSILNVARMGYFSSDRTIRGYCQDVWGVKI